jgi:antitoxin MazE
MQVAKWGNSLAVRLPASLVKEMRLSAGDEVEIRVDDDRALCLKKVAAREELLSRLRKFRGMLPAGFSFDREEANVR